MGASLPKGTPLDPLVHWLGRLYFDLLMLLVIAFGVLTPRKTWAKLEKPNFGTRGVGFFCMGHAEVLTFMTLPFLLNLG